MNTISDVEMRRRRRGRRGGRRNRQSPFPYESIPPTLSTSNLPLDILEQMKRFPDIGLPSSMAPMNPNELFNRFNQLLNWRLPNNNNNNNNNNNVNPYDSGPNFDRSSPTPPRRERLGEFNRNAKRRFPENFDLRQRLDAQNKRWKDTIDDGRDNSFNYRTRRNSFDEDLGRSWDNIKGWQQIDDNLPGGLCGNRGYVDNVDTLPDRRRDVMLQLGNNQGWCGSNDRFDLRQNINVERSMGGFRSFKNDHDGNGGGGDYSMMRYPDEFDQDRDRNDYFEERRGGPPLDLPRGGDYDYNLPRVSSKMDVGPGLWKRGRMSNEARLRNLDGGPDNMASGSKEDFYHDDFKAVGSLMPRTSSLMNDSGNFRSFPVDGSNSDTLFDDLMVLISKPGYVKFSANEEQMLKKTLIDLVLRCESSDYMPEFINSGLLRGSRGFYVTCRTKESMDWLLRQRLPLLDGAILTVRKNQFYEVVTASTFAPKCNRSEAEVLKLLRLQNSKKGFNFNDWTLKSYSASSSGVFITFDLTIDEANLLKENDCQLSFELKTLTFKISPNSRMISEFENFL